MNIIAANSNPHISNIHKPAEIHTFESSQPQSIHVPLLKKSTHLNHFKQIHAQIIKAPSEQQTNLMLAKLVESLVGSTHLDYASKVFEEMPDPMPFVFNTLIRGHALSGKGEEGVGLYIEMRLHGLEPDNFTYPFLLKACTTLQQGKGVHSLIFKSQNLGCDVYSQTSLVSFYSSFGDLECAKMVFDRMVERNVVSWTAMITGYMKLKRYNEGLGLFHQMQLLGIEPNQLTLVNVLTASAHLGAVEMGKWVHGYIDRKQVFVNPTLGTALVDMYMKCGYIHKASQAFDNLSHRSTFTWNAVIGGLAMHGRGKDALDRFAQMRMSRTKPDEITFIAVLSACTHSGLADKGREYFCSMRKEYAIEPSVKHYGCFVDLLGRIGHLQEAYETILNMPIEPNTVIWGALLNACNRHSNLELAEIVMEKLVELDPFNDGNYVLMANIYASKGRWDDVGKVRSFMKDRGILKTPGPSSIVIDNMAHEFTFRGSTHTQSKEIYSMLDEFTIKLKAEGYLLKSGQAIHDIDAKGKRPAMSAE